MASLPLRMNTTSVDAYLRDGCGRCEHYQTPACKVHRWTTELVLLRKMVLAAGLVEEMKWGSPTYTLGGKNVAMLMSFKDSCALQFFRGAELQDGSGLLEKPGPNSRFGRFLRFQSVAEVKAKAAQAKELLRQAVELERSGKKAEKPPPSEPMPAELEARLASDAALRKAFAALTPGRRRSHVLHVSGAKQQGTRERRVDRCAEDILAGRGFNER